jgi:hypothetical protein
VQEWRSGVEVLVTVYSYCCCCCSHLVGMGFELGFGRMLQSLDGEVKAKEGRIGCGVVWWRGFVWLWIVDCGLWLIMF